MPPFKLFLVCSSIIALLLLWYFAPQSASIAIGGGVIGAGALAAQRRREQARLEGEWSTQKEARRAKELEQKNDRKEGEEIAKEEAKKWLDRPFT